MEEQRTTTVRESDGVADRGAVRQETVAARSSASSGTVLKRVIWLIAGIIIALLALRIVLLLLGANQGSPFVDFIYNLSYPFAWPFFGIFGYEPQYGVVKFELSSLVAIAIYALIAWGIGRLATLNRGTV